MYRQVWESQVWSNPQVYRDQGTFQGCAVSSHGAGTNFPNAQFNHLSETNSKNKPVVIHTSDIHLNLTKGDKKEQVEGRGGTEDGSAVRMTCTHARIPAATATLGGGEQKWGHSVPSAAFQLVLRPRPSLKVGGVTKSPRLAPQSHCKKHQPKEPGANRPSPWPVRHVLE